MSDFESLDDFGDEGPDGPQTTVVKRGGDLVPIRIDDPAMAFVAGGLEPLLVAIDAKAREEAEGLDISDKHGRKAIASLAMKVAKSKTAIDEARKNFVRDRKEELKAIDAEGKRACDFLDQLKDEIRAPLTEFESRDKARIAGLESAITSMGQLSQWDGAVPTAAMIRERLNQLTEYANREWEEFAQKAGKVAGNVKHWLHVALEKAEKHEAEQAELARLRKEAAEREQKERDERIAREAAERAQKAAEAKAKAEQEAANRNARELARAIEIDLAKAAQAKEKAEREREAAEQRAARAEESRIAAEQRAKHQAEEAKRLAEIEKQQAIAAALASRPKPVIKGVPTEEQMVEAFEPTMADKKRVEQEALDDLVEIAGFPDEGLCRDLLKAIVNGKVRHVEIVY
jgi:colicin import membrane protein